MKAYETKAIKTFESFLRTWNPYAPHCVVVYGDTGVGKTFTIEYVAKKLKMEYVSYGSEDAPEIDKLKAISQTRGWMSEHILIHLDRPLWWMDINILKQLVKNARNPIVIEIDTSELKYYKSLNCTEIIVDPPPKTWIVQQIKKNKIVDKPKYKMINNDVRQALLLAMGSDGYGKENWIGAIEKYFKQGDTSSLEPSHLPVLLDTGLKLFYGYKLYNFIKHLIVADMTKRMEIMKGLKPTFRYSNPSLRYYEKLRTLKEQ